MTLRRTLQQLPPDYEIVLRMKGGDYSYTDTAKGWLDSNETLDNYELVTEIILPRNSPSPDYEPVNLHDLMSEEPPDEDWLAEPLLPRAKLTGVVSKRGEGKSLLLLDVAASLAAGQPTLDTTPDQPIHVLYLDMEMGSDDLYDRLATLGWTLTNPHFNQLADHLHYYQLPTLPPMDTEAGGKALEQLVEYHQTTLVVIDTVSRVISGDENAAEPFRELFRHTETRLKRKDVTLARLDHLGKDPDRGSRGSSAKEDPLDVVWNLQRVGPNDPTIVLTRSKGRQGWVPQKITVTQETTNGILKHTLPVEFAPDHILDIVADLDRLDVPQDAGRGAAQQALQKEGLGRRNRDVSQAVKFRKGRAKRNQSYNVQLSPELSPSQNLPGGTVGGDSPGQLEIDSLTRENTGDSWRGQSGTVKKGFGDSSPPLKGGTVPPQKSETDEKEDLPDPW